LWPNLFSLLRDALDLSSASSAASSSSSSSSSGNAGRSVQSFVQALTAVNHLFSCLVLVAHGTAAVRTPPGGLVRACV
jgi:hypothetical protein